MFVRGLLKRSSVENESLSGDSNRSYIAQTMTEES